MNLEIYKNVLEKIARRYIPNIKVRYHHGFKNLGGQLVIDRGRYKTPFLYLNPNTRGDMLAWIVLHEIGHYETRKKCWNYYTKHGHCDWGREEGLASAWADKEFKKLERNGYVTDKII